MSMRSLCHKPALLLVILVACAGTATAAGPNAFRAHLSGAAQVVPIETQAQGQAIFRLSADGQELWYQLIVANIDGVLMAHIHLAAPDANGPIVAWLYPDAPPPAPISGDLNGILAQGTITADDLVGPLSGNTMIDLIQAIRAGNTYVNVHTQEYPPGEIRGQIF
jgi:hypothetical protein